MKYCFTDRSGFGDYIINFVYFVRNKNHKNIGWTLYFLLDGAQKVIFQHYVILTQAIAAKWISDYKMTNIMNNLI